MSRSGEARAPRYVYYLHGKIVEDAGPRGVDPRFGQYDLPGILQRLSAGGLNVIAEQRPRNTDPSVYADKLVSSIQGRLHAGVPPSHITVIGGSKGAVIAALVSTRLKNAGIRYVLMGNCNDWLLRTFSPRLTGDVLSIYEATDDFGQSCQDIKEASPAIGRFEEIRLNTGLRHGFLYRPLDEWVRPALAWAKR